MTEKKSLYRMADMRLIPILLIILCTSCFKRKKNTKDNITVPIKSEISTIDPHQSYDLVSNLVVYQLYEALYQYHYLKRPYTLEPLLAEALPEVTDNGLTYKIKIKKDIPYHDSLRIEKSNRTVKAEDFITSLKRLAFKGTNSKGWWLLKDKIVGLDEFRKKAGTDIQNLVHMKVKGLKAINDYTFTIKLKSPFPQLAHILAMAFTTPIPEEVILKTKNKLNKQEFGTGPFTIKDIQFSKHAKLQKFGQYKTSHYPITGDRFANESGLLKRANAKLPLSKELEFLIVPRDEVRWSQFIEKEIDYVDIPPPKLHSVLNLNGKIKEEYERAKIELDISSSLVFWWFSFNMKDPLIGSNKNLRKAIAHAINIEKYVSNFYYNTGRKANSIFPPGVLGYTPSKDLPYQYNLKKARKFLEKAGYPNGKGLPVLEFHTRRDSERHIHMAQFLKRELSKIGIAVKIIVNKFTEFLDKSRKGKLQFWQGGWLMDYPDPENILQLLYSRNANGGPNKTGFSNTQYDKLYDKYMVTVDESKKLEVLRKMEEIVNEEIPWIMSNYSINYLAKHHYLKNFRYSDLIFNMYKYLEK